MTDLARIWEELGESFSAQNPAGSVCQACSKPVLITRLVGPSRARIGDSAIYNVVRVNRIFYNSSNLNGLVHWQIKTNNQIFHETKNGDIQFAYRIPDLLNADLIKVYAYSTKPLDEVSVDTWIEKDYARKLRTLIDTGVKDVDELFKNLCAFYLDRSGRYPNHDDWEAREDVGEMLEVMGELFGKNVGSLDRTDQKRWWAVNRALPKTKFGGEWDKVQHFLAGANISADLGETAGWNVAWLVEKYDSLKRVWGDITGTRQKHQIGFDWADFEWTAAGASLAEILDKVSESECKNIMKAFANGGLSLSTIYKPTGIVGGFGEFSPSMTPFMTTNIDRVKLQIQAMKKLVLSHK